MNLHLRFLVVAGLTGLLSIGCVSKKRIEGVEVPTEPETTQVAEAPPVAPPPPVADVATPEPTAEPTPEPTPEANPCNNYIVVKGDTLWDISGMKLAYHDNFQWPLLFKANRDQIRDPDLIYPKQEFCIRQDFTEQDIKKARKDASDTPVYVPHTKPREVLPLDYF